MPGTLAYVAPGIQDQSGFTFATTNHTLISALSETPLFENLKIMNKSREETFSYHLPQKQF